MKACGKTLKAILRFLTVFVFCLPFLGSLPAAKAESLPVRVMIASDIHYLARELYEGSELFMQILSQSDGKMTHKSEELLDTLIKEALAQRPDALILTGDLTFNGEKASHEALAAAMDRLWQAGIPVYVIPGNHDINCPSARRYLPYAYEPTEAVDEQGFRAIWQNCMLPPEDTDSLSYTLKLRDGVWLTMADVSVYKDQYASCGWYRGTHDAWLKGVLSKARDAGAQVISVTHQSLNMQTVFDNDSFMIFGREKMMQTLAEGGVGLNLSGHLHIQHERTENGITDIATGAFCVYPHHYGMLTVYPDGRAEYSACTVDPRNLPDGFMEESARFFANTTEIKLQSALSRPEISAEERTAMLDYAVRFNTAYFSGTLDADNEAWLSDEGYGLWKKWQDEIRFGKYMLSTLEYERPSARDGR